MGEPDLEQAFRRFRDAGASRSLLDAALLVARCVRRAPGASAPVPSMLAERLDALARQAEPYVAPHLHLQGRVEGLCHALADVAGFGGDRERYYELDNSVIDRVLESGRGIPITLAVIYVEVAQRLGLTAAGVNFPGHFLVRVEEPAADASAATARALLIDPFAGRLITRAECETLLQSLEGAAVRLGEEHLRPADPLGVLVRMLNNLKQLALRQSDLPDALLWSERILLAEPALVLERRDRAVIYEQLGMPEAAVAELEQLEAAIPDPTLRERVRRRREQLAARIRSDRIVH